MGAIQDTVSNIISNTSKLTNVEMPLKETHLNRFDATVKDLDKLIFEFNKTQKFYTAFNARNLKKVLKSNPLPNYEGILNILMNEPNIKKKVIEEFNTLNYLNKVWRIDNIEHQDTNLMILIYRTTLLNHLSYLREGSAQISSTLEEMAALLALRGENTVVFESTKYWISDWKNEGFSEELFKQLRSKKLL